MEQIKQAILKTPAAKHWEKIQVIFHNGIIIPLFSLKTSKNCGIGEYLDLIQVIDWCKHIGFDVIQLLPLNETGIDPSPYNAISSCALNPLHISLHALNLNNDLKTKLKKFNIFHIYQRVHYLQIRKMKLEFLYEYYLLVFDEIKTDKNFQEFLKTSPWLEEFALFRSLQRAQNYKTWDLWPQEFQNINNKNIDKYLKIYNEDVHFYYFLQYLCFSQMQQVKNHAEKNNILLQGDVPILISKNSSDVWFNKAFFNLNKVAGAPPDSYSIYGQNWGFPLFNWDTLKQDYYSWWKRRLKIIEPLYHMYRIDHVVGFFRIWSMNLNEDATQGRFFPRDPTIWNKNGKECLLMMLNASKLLPIAEDLGLIPKIVYKVLKDLGICGIKVIPWEKNIFGYIKFNNYEPLSVSTLSTHDSDTFQQWWAGYTKGSFKLAKFLNWSYSKKLTHAQRKELLQKAHHTSSIFHINLLQEYLALYPEFVWEDPDDERINVPGTMRPTNWSYRFKPLFETITEHKNLENDLKEILK